MTEMFNYLSIWIQIFYIIWFILYKKNIKISSYLNPYYLNIILLGGYILFMYNELLVKGEQYEITFYIVNSILHILPFFSMCSLKIGTKHSLFTAIILISLYLLYLKLRNKTVCDIYLNDPNYKSWKDIIK